MMYAKQGGLKMAEIVQFVLDAGLPGALLIAVWKLWAETRRLTDIIIDLKTDFQEQKRLINARILQLDVAQKDGAHRDERIIRHD